MVLWLVSFQILDLNGLNIVRSKSFSVALHAHVAALKQTCERVAVYVVESCHAFKSSKQPKETSI